jgi:hypothetical protein
MGLEIKDLALGAEPWLTAAQVRVRYTPWTLLEGRLKSIEASEARWRVHVRDGQIDFGYVPPQRDKPAQTAINLPFDSAGVTSLVVDVDHAGRHVPVPVSGSIARSVSPSTRGDHAGSISIGPAVINDITLAQLKASLAVDARGVTIAALWPALKDAAIGADARVDLTADGTTATIDLDMAEFAMTDTHEIQELIPALAEVDLSGRFALSGRMNYARGEFKPLLTLSAADATLAHPEWPIAIASASAAITFDSLAPLRTQGTQRVNIARAMTGEIDIADAAIDFTMNDLHSITIDAAGWNLEDGGVFSASPFALDLRQPRIATTIECENLDLNFWLTMLSQGRADGEGRLRGEVALTWDPRAYPRIQFVSGGLVADPPVGFIRTHDAHRLSVLLDESDPRFSIDERLSVVKERIIEALQDLGFTSLVLEFIPTGADTTLRAEIKGKGRFGERPQEFSALVLNIGHFAERFQTALSARAAYESLRSRPGRPRDATKPAGE